MSISAYYNCSGLLQQIGHQLGCGAGLSERDSQRDKSDTMASAVAYNGAFTFVLYADSIRARDIAVVRRASQSRWEVLSGEPGILPDRVSALRYGAWCRIERA
jgi:hypothetical protein